MESTRTTKEPTPIVTTATTAPNNYYDDIYRKISEYYSYQLNNNADVKDLAASNELMNYYQMLRAYYEQSMAVPNHPGAVDATSSSLSKVEAIDVHRPNSIKINIESGGGADGADDENQSTRNSPNNITISRSAAGDVSINVQNTCQELSISCKTTPPKKRYSSHRTVSESPPTPLPLPTPPIVSEKINCEAVATSGGGRNRSTAGISVRQQLMEYRQKQQEQQEQKQQQQQLQNVAVKEKSSADSYISPKEAFATKPITSTYLQLMRSMGLTDEDSMKFDQQAVC